MLISVFKRNLFVNSLLLLPFTIVVRIFSLIFPEKLKISEEGGIFYQVVLKILPDDPFLQSIISILLVFIMAVQINRLVIKNRMGNEITLLPGLFFIILVSLTPEMLTISPIQIGTFFIILSFINLYKTYKKYNSELFLFNAGLYIGISAMFYNNLIVFLIPVLLGYFSIRSFIFREILQILAGLVFVIYCYTFYLFWTDEVFVFSPFTYNSLGSYFSGDISTYIVTVVYLTITLILLFTYRSFTIKKSIQSQKKINIVFWYLLLTFLFIWFLNPALMFGYFYLIAFGLSYFTSAIFLRLKNNLVSEIVYVVIVFSILIYHFQLYFLNI